MNGSHIGFARMLNMRRRTRSGGSFGRTRGTPSGLRLYRRRGMHRRLAARRHASDVTLG